MFLHFHSGRDYFMSSMYMAESINGAALAWHSISLSLLVTEVQVSFFCVFKVRTTSSHHKDSQYCLTLNSPEDVMNCAWSEIVTHRERHWMISWKMPLGIPEATPIKFFFCLFLIWRYEVIPVTASSTDGYYSAGSAIYEGPRDCLSQCSSRTHYTWSSTMCHYPEWYDSSSLD